MYEIADRLLAAVDAGRQLAVATAVSIEGSAPRTVGTSMAYDGNAVIGSIAGGCVEAEVVAACEAVLADGGPRTVEYGIEDETAFVAGLSCGGQLRIHIQLLDARLADLLRRREAVTTIVPCEGAAPLVFVELPPEPARMIIFGAMEFSTALAAAAAVLGYRVTVCDPRPLFATADRFAGAEVVVQWPTEFLAERIAAGEVDERTVLCVLSHDSRFDSKLIDIALRSQATYVGAMGSRTTHDRRLASLAERGVEPHRIQRLRSPIGLDLGASTPEETAISILAEVLAARTGASIRPLSTTDGAIHPTAVRATR